jgi:hypothetical protein
MALIPNFDRIVATITDSDIEKFLHSAAPDDDKQRVRNASSREIKMRLVGGYLIRTNQITSSRLNPKPVKTKVSAKAAAKPAKATKAAKPAKAAEPVAVEASSAI